MWKLQLDLDFHACGQLQRHQGFDRLGGGVLDVDQTLVSPALKLLTAILVLVDSAQDGFLLTFRTFVVHDQDVF